MKIAFGICLLALATATSVSAMEPEFEYQQDWRNASMNLTHFLKGFVMGGFGKDMQNIAHCVNDSVRITEVLTNDMEKIISGSHLDKVHAITDLFYHLVRDIPGALGDCEEIKDEAMKIFHRMMDTFKPHEFKATLWKLIKHLGPVITDITHSGEAFKKGDWYTAGKMLGNIFYIITDENSVPQEMSKSAETIKNLMMEKLR